jgi:ArsR family transcriptional regulator, arsenate/arsenite/antimonite-responsive transcriptional repressor
MKKFIKTMKALSDPNRLKIVNCCKAVLGVSQPTVSSHLKVLEEAGLVSYKKNGLWVNYYLTNGESSPYAAALLGNLRHWLEDDPDVALWMESLPTVSKKVICRK